MELYGWIDIGIGAGLIGLVALISISAVAAAFFGRTGRYGLNSAIMLVAFTAIIVVANVISFENTSRIDVTATNQFSLASRTKQLLSNLDQPVRATAFYIDEVGQDPNLIIRSAKVEETLKEFDARSSKFSFRIVDPDLKPDITSRYFGARPTGFVTESVVVEGLDSGLIDIIQPTDIQYSQLEQDLVTGLLVATEQEQRTVYFLTGHGERDFNSALTDGYGAVRDGLEQDNYLVRELEWDPGDANVSVPDDAALVIMARPTIDLALPHFQTLNLFLQGLNSDGSSRREGGRLIVLLEPDAPPSILQFLSIWGILPDTGYIRDLPGSVEGVPHTLKLDRYNQGASPEIIFPQGQPLQTVFMPGATGLDLLDDGARVLLPLAASSENSYLIEDPERTDPITGGENADVQGPFYPVVLARAASPVGVPLPSTQPSDAEISSMIVFGDSDFLTNANYGRGSGADLFHNSANYLLGDYSLVSIRPKAFTFREFNLDRNERKFVRVSSWTLLPGILALMAGLVWWVRR